MEWPCAAQCARAAHAPALVTLAIDRWPWFLGGLRNLAITLGIIATGDQLALTDFLDPGALLRVGLSSAAVLWQAFWANIGLTSAITAFAYFLAWLSYCAAFGVMAYKVFWWQVELLIASLAGMCLLPTLCFQRTAFVATGVLSYAANMFARFLLGALLAGALWRHLESLTLVAILPRKAGLDMAIQGAFAAVATAWILAACFLSVNRIAGMLTSGVPGMAGGHTVGGVFRLLATGAAAAATLGGAAAVSTLGAARGLAAGGQALYGGTRAAIQGVQAAHRGASLSLGGTARAIYAGAKDAASGGLQEKLGTYMRAPTRFAARSGQQTLDHLMQGTRGAGQHDQTHGSVRHH